MVQGWMDQGVMKRVARLVLVAVLFTVGMGGPARGDDRGDGAGAARKPGEKQNVKKFKPVRQPRTADSARPSAPTVNVTLTGRVRKKVTERKGKKHVTYYLVDAEGRKTLLPRPKGKDADAVKLNDYVGAQVKVVGLSTIRIAKVTTIGKVGDAPAKEVTAQAVAASDPPKAK